MSETITLPKSGIVLTRPDNAWFYTLHIDGFATLRLRDLERGGSWSASVNGTPCRDGTREEAIEWLDEVASKALPALLSADALARALWATVLRERYGESDSWDELPTCKKDAAMAVAHSVLAALGGQP